MGQLSKSSENTNDIFEAAGLRLEAFNQFFSQVCLLRVVLGIYGINAYAVCVS